MAEQHPEDFDLTNTYIQVIEPQLKALAEDCEKRGIPFAFYVVPKIENGNNDAREFASGEGDFIRSLTYMARNWTTMMAMVQAASRFSQNLFGMMKAIAQTEMRYENENLENGNEPTEH